MTAEVGLAACSRERGFGARIENQRSTKIPPSKIMNDG